MDEENKAAELAAEEEYIPVAIADDEPDELPEDDERYQSNASRIRGQLAAEGVSEQKKYKKKLSLGKWIADQFYRNKFECVCVIAILVIALVIGGIHLYKKMQPVYDYRIAVYTYDSELSDEQLEQISDILRKYGDDIDGDGEVTVGVKLYHPYTGGYFAKYNDAQKLYDDIFGDRSNILIMTDTQCRDNIVERFGEHNFERLNGDERWVSLAGTGLAGDETGLPVELGLMMYRSGTHAMDIQDVQKRHDEAEQMLLRIMEDYPDLFTYGD